jgi:hypothetical protein
MTSIINILDDINKDPSTISKYKNNAAVCSVFEYAFIPEKKFLLPEGKPPFRPVDVPYTLRSANFMNEIRRFYIFTKEREELSPVRREALFIQLLEIFHEFEANLMIAIKDQKLTDLYPNITYDLLEQHGFLPSRPKSEEVIVKIDDKESEVDGIEDVVKKPTRKPRKSVVK